MKKDIVWPIIKFTVAFGLLAVVIAELNREAMTMVWKRVSITWFLISILSFYAVIWSIARRYWVLLGAKINFHDLFQVVLYQAIMGNLITTAAGAAWYVATLRHEHNVKVARGLFSLAVARFGDLLGFLASLIVSTIILWRQVPSLHVAVLVMICLLVTVIVVFSLTMVFRQRLVEMISRVLELFRLQEKAFVQKVFVALVGFLDQLGEESLKSIGAFTLFSVLTLGSMLFFAYSSLQIFDVHIEVWPVVFVVAFTQIISLVPIQVFGGLGLYDYTYLYLYGLFGFERTEFVAVIIGLRICYYVANLALLPLVVITARSTKPGSCAIEVKQKDS